MKRSSRGGRYLTGENLKVVWAEFSTLSQAVCLNRHTSIQHKHSYFLTCKLGPGFVLLAKVCPWSSLQNVTYKLTPSFYKIEPLFIKNAFW
jgi:hypothetical protein